MNSEPHSEPIEVLETETRAGPYYYKPLVTRSKLELVGIIKTWIDDHPTARFPELARYDRWDLENNFAVEATLLETEERVWILRLGVIKQYLAWALEKDNGTYMLLKAQYMRKHGGHVYFPWLGGDLGFSEQFVARFQAASKKRLSFKAYASKRGFNENDVLLEHDITKEDLEPDLLQTGSRTADRKGDAKAEDSDSSLTSLSSLQPLIKQWTQKVEEKIGKKRACATTHPGGNKAVKLGPNEEISRTSSPIATQTDQPPFGNRNEFSTPNVGAAQSCHPAPEYLEPESRFLPPTPPSTYLSVPHLADPFSPIPNSSIVGQVTFHCFLSDPSLGAIPHSFPLTSLPTHKKFMNIAISAHETVPSANGQVIAASVRIAGAPRAIVVKKDGTGKAGWDEVSRTAGSVGKRGQSVIAEVRCVCVRG
ncbi:MAG: hypothetical protein Q9219_006312 [cf. Caloplaca sp. 3 TL-2023]